jgi:sugar/nucleoside kinase (ribokinase family)
VEPLVCTVGDLVRDVVVHTAQPMVRHADVPAHVTAHRGGSAANTAAAVVHAGGRARFVGCVGADDDGMRLLTGLVNAGVDCVGPRRGRTGVVVVVVEPDGERTMFSDRRDSSALDTFEPAWLDDVAVLHVPAYAFVTQPLARTAEAMLAAARERGILCSVDPSSVTMIDTRLRELLERVQPDVLLCNREEAEALGVDEHGWGGVRHVVVKQGGDPVLLRGEVSAEIPAIAVDGPLDATGAGDAFAAGFLLALVRGAPPVDAARAGHEIASKVVRGAGADAWV